MMEFNIEQLMPKFILGDRNGYALAKAIEVGLRALLRIAGEGLAMIDDVEAMPEWRLDEMAWELNAAWYDYDADIERKRAQIAGAQTYYNRIGTPSAVQGAIADVFGDGVVREWFEYGGEPYHFEVRTSNTSILRENRAKFLKLLELVKNLRSVLDNVYYEGEGRADVNVFAGASGFVGEMTVRASRIDSAV